MFTPACIFGKYGFTLHEELRATQYNSIEFFGRAEARPQCTLKHNLTYSLWVNLRKIITLCSHINSSHKSNPPKNSPKMRGMHMKNKSVRQL